VGATIADFHNQGINHADLNANNILIDSEKVFLIDFDHSKQCKPRRMWQNNNMKRLKRSIDKLTEEKHMQSTANKWQLLIQAYKTKRT
jgi:3-deoxy-D-manno-octulosonic acid kinase